MRVPIITLGRDRRTTGPRPDASENATDADPTDRPEKIERRLKDPAYRGRVDCVGIRHREPRSSCPIGQGSAGSVSGIDGIRRIEADRAGWRHASVHRRGRRGRLRLPFLNVVANTTIGSTAAVSVDTHSPADRLCPGHRLQVSRRRAGRGARRSRKRERSNDRDGQREEQFSLSGTFDITTRFGATSDRYVAATQTWKCSAATCSGPGAGTP